MVAKVTDSLGRGHDFNVTQVYAWLAFLSFSVFGSLHIFVEGNALLGLCELAAAAATGLTLLILRVAGNVAIGRFCLLLIMMTLLMVMLVTGGTRGTGILWFFMFPVAAFFLAGTKEGLWWMAGLMAMVTLAWLADYSGSLAIYYNPIEMRQLIVTLTVVGVGIYAYQRYREIYARQAGDSRAELQANLKQEADQHAKVDKAKNEFVTLASHQLRTPISAIKWSSEMLLGGDAGELGEDQRDAIKGIEESNDRLAVIVDALLLVSSLDLGKVEVQDVWINLPALSRAIMKAEQEKFPDKNLTVKEEYQDSLPRLRADSRITAVILRNVFSNALKYSLPGGTVTVSVKTSDEKLRQDSRGSLLVQVSDNGLGIPLNQQGQVFDKMFRAANAKAKDTDGTGLGLYIVKELLGRVGGKIWFESEEGSGTTFFVLLAMEGMEGGSQVQQKMG